MANNKNINQVIYGTSTLIDLTNDTVTPERMYKGIKAHMADGSTTTGTAEVTVENTRLIMPEGFIGLVSSTSDEHTPIPEAIVVSKTITHDGTYYAASDNADGYNPIVVNVSGGGGLVYESGTYTPTADIAHPSISFTATHENRPFSVIIGATETGTSRLGANYIYYCCIESFNDSPIGNIYYNASSRYYGHASYSYGTSSGASTGQTSCTGLTGTNSSSLSFWLSNTAFLPYAGSDTRYFKSGRTYKWIAVWAPSS